MVSCSTHGLSPSLLYGWQAPSKSHTPHVSLGRCLCSLYCSPTSPFPGYWPPQPFSSPIHPCPEASQKFITCACCFSTVQELFQSFWLKKGGGRSDGDKQRFMGGVLPWTLLPCPTLLQLQGCYSCRDAQMKVIHEVILPAGQELLHFVYRGRAALCVTRLPGVALAPLLGNRVEPSWSPGTHPLMLGHTPPVLV